MDDARALLSAGRNEGAIYLCGYAVELALKARICETLGWNRFPDTGREAADYRSFRTHDLKVLLRLSGQESRIMQDLPDTWWAVSNWNPDLRYRIPGSASQSGAATLLERMRQVMQAL